MTREDAVILVVDDRPANLEVLFEVFDETRFDVSFVTDGGSCLELAEAEHPDLILLDVTMPGMDGFEVCQHLKANPQTRNIPVIFMSARSDASDKQKGFALGAVDYISKPIHPDEVLARINTHLRIKRLQQELQETQQALQRALEREHLLHSSEPQNSLP